MLHVQLIRYMIFQYGSELIPIQRILIGFKARLEKGFLNTQSKKKNYLIVNTILCSMNLSLASDYNHMQTVFVNIKPQE